MLCPACRTKLVEGQAACPACGFTLAAADNVFGPPLRVNPGVSDLVDALTAGDHRRMEASLRTFQRRFPQITPAVVTFALQRGYPLSPYLFWLFNRSGIGSQLEKGSANRCVLIGLEIPTRRMGLMIGYGLEPFISVATLDEAVERASEDLRAARFADAVEKAFGSLATRFAQISEAMPRTYGIQWDDIMTNDSRWRERTLDQQGLY